MKKIVDFVKTALLGGMLILLPLTILIFAVNWIFNFVRQAISPLTVIVMTKSQFQGIIADLLVIIFILLACFLLGILVRTKLGKWIYDSIENAILKKAPGYSLIKETIAQFLGSKQSPFSSVALVQIFGNDTMASAFITDSHDDGSYTVFIPTGPNPTSGNIYHLKKENVHPVDVPVEDAMRSIISCGAGSAKLIAGLKK